MTANCKHPIVQADNYGETCVFCGEVLAGFGFLAEGSDHCVSHLWLQDGDSFVCVYCEERRPAAENGEVSHE